MKHAGIIKAQLKTIDEKLARIGADILYDYAENQQDQKIVEYLENAIYYLLKAIKGI